MPVRSLNSSVHRWLGAEEVLGAARRWAERLAQEAPDVQATGVFGSYARGDAGVGSDLDLLVILRDGAVPPDHTDDRFAVENLPVPAERIIYSAEDWRSLARENNRFYRTVRREALWLVGAAPEASRTPES